MKAMRMCFAVLALTLASWPVHGEEAAQETPEATLNPSLEGEGGQALEDQQPDSSLVERMQAIDEVDPAKWGIRKDCISIRNIRNISFQDDQSAIIKVGRGKEVLMRLRRECRGIRYEGFIYQARGSRLCARFDRLKLYKTGITCQIESFEPYIKVENVKSDESEST